MMVETIPGPRAYPLVGNIADIDPGDAVASLGKIAQQYGPIYKLSLAGSDKVFISTRDLVDEVSDETRFTKLVSGPLAQLRNCVGDSLFTAHYNEPNWDVAHRVLMPAFGPLAIRGMFDEMHDIASQMVIKWARFGPQETIDVTADFTRLTLDAIALCSMSTRFNSFYHEEMHPFVGSMIGLLEESGRRAARPKFFNYLMPGSQAQYESDIETLRRIATEVLVTRRANPSEKKDLLDAMIHGKDPKTGEGLTDESILNNMIVFLIAGHETTSGLLSFMFYYMLKLPHVFEKAQKEIDEVVGRGPVTIEHMSKLPYIEACLRETLRLHPTAPVITLQARPDLEEERVSIGNGKYEVSRGQGIVALLIQIQRDPAVYGADANEFRAERMLDENFKQLPKNSWKPFGNGVRGCIGRAFAWQESLLITAMLLQTFEFRLKDPSYDLKIKQTLTIKPGDFFMHATLRDHVDAVHLEKTLHGSSQISIAAKKVKHQSSPSATSAATRPMSILYGSDSGTCEAMAHSLARVALSHGYRPFVNHLDSAAGKLATGLPIVIISSSYNGQPPGNATQFVTWLESLKGKSLEGVSYAIYGCGNRDYTTTFHRVPRLIDDALEKNNAIRLAETGLGDVLDGDIFSDFDKWQEEQLWPALGSDGGEDVSDCGFEVQVDTCSRPSELRQDVKQATVLTNEILTAVNEPEKRQITLRLPAGLEYRTGDHLAVLPMNDWNVVSRVFKWAKLPWDAVLTIPAGANTTLPTGRQVSARDLISGYVELSQPATRKNIAKIAASTKDEATRQSIMGLSTDFETEIVQKRRSVLDILEEFPSVVLPLSEFLAMLPPMRIRQYSISSSPLADPSIAALTWSVLNATSYSSSKRKFMGVASNYLASVTDGDRIHIIRKPALKNFHPPANDEETPVVMACAGTGLAPFRGFVQERAVRIQAGRRLAPAYLFIGCRHPERDAISRNELQLWEKSGVVKVFYAFSQASRQSKGCKHVQDRLWYERATIKKALSEDGAKFYVCGSAAVGRSLEDTMKKIYADLNAKMANADAEEWFQELKLDRYTSEIFT